MSTKFVKSFQIVLQIPVWPQLRLPWLAISGTGWSFSADNSDDTWYTFRVDKEGDPADDNEKPAWEVVGDNVERHFSRENQLKAGDRVIHS